MPGKLYIVATPIGNSEDMTDRAKRVLREAGVVAAEDTRTTQKLFQLLGIQNKLVANHKFNENRQAGHLVSELLAGKNVAVVSDAGTPCVSDPGHVIVSEAVSNGIEVVGVCGASAVMTALSVSGFPLVSFAFYGFFPRENKAMKDALREIKDSGVRVSVFFESPRRVLPSLALIAEELPEARLCLCNDLTKLYERVYRGLPSEVLAEVSENPDREKGEYTMVIYTPGAPPAVPAAAPVTCESMLVDHIARHGGTVKSAIQELQLLHRGKIAKKELYAAALRLKALLPGLFPSDAGGDEYAE